MQDANLSLRVEDVNSLLGTYLKVSGRPLNLAGTLRFLPLVVLPFLLIGITAFHSTRSSILSYEYVRGPSVCYCRVRFKADSAIE